MRLMRCATAIQQRGALAPARRTLSPTDGLLQRDPLLGNTQAITERNGHDQYPYCKILFGPDHASGDRSMARLSVLLILGLCLPRPTIAAEPTPKATTQQVQKTVDRAIGYLQTESA